MPLAHLAGIAVFGLAGLFYWTMGHLLFPEQIESSNQPLSSSTAMPVDACR